MHNISKQVIQSDINELTSIISKIENDYSNFPRGSIQLQKAHNNCYSHKYVEYKDGIPHKQHIKKTDSELITSLCRKSYYKDLIPVLKHDIEELERFKNNYDYAKKYEIYRNLHPEKKKYVRPIFPTVESKVEDWKNKPDRSLESELRQGKKWASGQEPCEPLFVTDFGMRFRSKSEYMIAIELHQRQLEGQLLFKYEQALTLADGGVVYPDFEIISLKTGNIYYYEHFGIMDDPEYLDSFIRKMHRYSGSGILLGRNLIATYEANKKPLHLSQIKAALEILD